MTLTAVFHGGPRDGQELAMQTLPMTIVVASRVAVEVPFWRETVNLTGVYRKWYTIRGRRGAVRVGERIVVGHYQWAGWRGQ